MNLLKSIFLFLFVTILFLKCSEIQKEPKSTRTIKERTEDKLYPMEGHFMAQNYPEERFAIDAYRASLSIVKKQKDQAQSRTGSWDQQGPGNIGGRINTVALNPNNKEEMMLGYSFGGIFKTTDNGANWFPIFDDQDILAISDIKYDPNDPSVVYVGTGDLNISGYPVTGNGIFKSNDSGSSWDRVGLTEAGVIAEVGMSKANSNVIYAASMGLPFERTSDRGLYKSEDGGSTWENVFFLNDSTGVIDIEVHPENENIVFAATWTRIRNNRESIIGGEETGIYKTIDGGTSWTKLTNGLPTGEMIRPGLAMFDGNPDVLYSIFNHDQDTVCAGIQIENVYKTIDAGKNWTIVPNGEEDGLPCNAMGGFGWYFGQIRVNPQDENDIYLLGVEMFRKTGDSDLWTDAVPPWWTYDVHADKHDLVFDNDGNIILATDGGAYRLPEEGDPIYDWTDIENIVTTQFYRVAVNNFDDGNFYGGAQDNGTTGGNDDNINEWPRIFGGDGFQMVFHPTDPNIHYVETQNGSIRVTYDGGVSYSSANDGLEGRRNWDMQYILSKELPEILYTGTDRMFRGTSFGSVEWTAISGVLTDTTDVSTASSHTITTIDESPVNTNILYCGVSDGYVWRSMDSGTTWERINEGLPRRYISDIKASKNDEATVYVTIQGYRDNDNTPYIYKSTDNGDTWIHINGDLPQIAINDILLPSTDDDDSDVFVATDGGVYFTRNGGGNWVRLGNDMPIMPVYDMAINDQNELVAGTFARGIYTFDLAQLEETSVVDEQVFALEVYPTVTSDVFYIDGADRASQVYIYNEAGVQVAKRSMTDQFNVSELPSGLYFLKTDTGEVGRIVKI